MAKTVHKVYVLDNSGSMGSIAEEAVNHYNDGVRGDKEDAGKGIPMKVSLVTFNTDVYEHLWGVDALDLQECRQGDYVADGWTSMLDGIGYAVDKLRETTDYKNEDNTYLIVVITDGQENHSTHYNWGTVREMMSSLQATGRWTFTFMGCDKTYIEATAKNLDVPLGNVALWSNSTKKTAKRGYAASNRALRAATAKMSAGEHVECAYSCDAGKLADYMDESLDADLGLVDDPVAAPLTAGFVAPASMGVSWNSSTLGTSAQPSSVCQANIGDTGQGAAIFSTRTKVTSWKS